MNNKYSLPEEGGLIEEEALQDIIRRYEKIATRICPDEYGVSAMSPTTRAGSRTPRTR